MTRKISEIDKIDELNSRLKDVGYDLTKLGGSNENISPFVAAAVDLEDPASILAVADEEILMEKYLSPEEQAIANVLH